MSPAEFEAARDAVAEAFAQTEREVAEFGAAALAAGITSAAERVAAFLKAWEVTTDDKDAPLHFALTDEVYTLRADDLRELLAAASHDANLNVIEETTFEVDGPGMAVDTRAADPAANAKVGDTDPEPDWEGEFCAEEGAGYDTCTLHKGHEGKHLQAQWMNARGSYVVTAVWS